MDSMSAGAIGAVIDGSTGPASWRERLATYAREVDLRFLASLRLRFTLGFS
jgi:hypothetical protein